MNNLLENRVSKNSQEIINRFDEYKYLFSGQLNFYYVISSDSSKITFYNPKTKKKEISISNKIKDEKALKKKFHEFIDSNFPILYPID